MPSFQKLVAHCIRHAVSQIFVQNGYYVKCRNGPRPNEGVVTEQALNVIEDKIIEAIGSLDLIPFNEPSAQPVSKPGPKSPVTIARLREALTPPGTWVSRGEVAERLGVDDRTLRRRLPDLAELLGEELEQDREEGRHGRARLRLVERKDNT